MELRRLEVERDIRLEEQHDAEAGLAAASAELAATTAHLEALERAQAAQVPGLAARLREVYKLGSGGYLRLLLSVDDVREMGRAYRTVAALAALDRQRVRAHQTTSPRCARRARSWKPGARRRPGSRPARARPPLRRPRAVEARAALVARIDAQRDLNAQLAGELDAARAKLAAAVSSLPPGAAPALPFRPFRGALDWPVSGAVVDALRRRSARRGTARPSPETASRSARQPGRRSSPSTRGPSRMRPRSPALVPSSSSITGTGLYTLYGYLATLGVTKGARVEKGPGWARSARRRPRARPTLYFEVRVDGKPSDPLQWLKPRLLKTP